MLCETCPRRMSVTVKSVCVCRLKWSAANFPAFFGKLYPACFPHVWLPCFCSWLCCIDIHTHTHTHVHTHMCVHVFATCRGKTDQGLMTWTTLVATKHLDTATFCSKVYVGIKPEEVPHGMSLIGKLLGPKVRTQSTPIFPPRTRYCTRRSKYMHTRLSDGLIGGACWFCKRVVGSVRELLVL